MAAWTLTSSDVANVPRLEHTGVTVKNISFTLGAAQSFSASDVILLAKVPDQVNIVDWTLRGMAGGDGQVFNLGVGTAQGGTGGAGAGGETALSAAFTLSATAQTHRGTGNVYKVSLSGDAEVQWTWVYAVRTSGTSTATASLQLTLYYVPDGAL
jgi:hypothetical protein